MQRQLAIQEYGRMIADNGQVSFPLYTSTNFKEFSARWLVCTVLFSKCALLNKKSFCTKHTLLNIILVIINGFCYKNYGYCTIILF